MDLDLSPFFEEYAQMAAEMDEVFNRVQASCPDEVTCELGCCDCCYAMFDLTLVEAMALNQAFRTQLPQEVQKAVLEEADVIDRKTFQIKRRAFKERQKGVEAETILKEIGKERVRCPLLSQDNTCLLYEHRPLTCRLYGLPMSVGGEVHTCTRSNFVHGQKYPTVFMDKIQDRLLDLSQRLVDALPTRHTKLAEILVPVSMALLTEYDDEYLGIVQEVPAQSGHGIQEWSAGGGEES